MTIEDTILPKCREMIKLLNVQINHFPKHEKFALTSQIRNVSYEIHNLLVECRKRYHKKTTLTELDIRHEQLRMMINLAFELGYYDYHNGKSSRTESESLRRYTAISSRINVTPLHRGIDFVGYRTWRNKRLIRKRSLRNFHRAVKKQDHDTIKSLLTHSKNTSSHRHLRNTLQ